jgi:hypothetical protein
VTGLPTCRTCLKSKLSDLSPVASLAIRRVEREDMVDAGYGREIEDMVVSEAVSKDCAAQQGASKCKDRDTKNASVMFKGMQRENQPPPSRLFVMRWYMHCSSCNECYQLIPVFMTV